MTESKFNSISPKALLNHNPSLAKEWHPTKNGFLTPLDVTYGSDKKVWWRCRRGHEWQARIGRRNRGERLPVLLWAGC